MASFRTENVCLGPQPQKSPKWTFIIFSEDAIKLVVSYPVVYLREII